MAKDTIEVNGKEVVVREDTAKAFRAVNWMTIILATFVLLMAVLAAIFLFNPILERTFEPSAISGNSNAAGH